MKNVRIIDLMQTAIVVIDKNFNIIEANNAFQQRLCPQNNNTVGQKCFNAAYNFAEGCGHKEAGSCPARRSFLSRKTESAIHHYWIEDHAVVEELTTTPIVEKNGEIKYVIEEYRDITKLLGLNKGIIGICSYCRKIRDSDGEWIPFESYLHKHTGADFSHGICEECNESVSTELNIKNLCSH